MTPRRTIGVDDVLEACACEPAGDDATLSRYGRLYPQSALALADLAHELRLVDVVDDATAPRDEAWGEESWRRFEAAAAANGEAPAPVADPFSASTPARLAEIRRDLRIPSAVLNGFRDRLVLASSVPRRFAAQLADALGTTPDRLEAFLALPPRLNPAASHKADVAPAAAAGKITFALLLEQAMIPPERRRELSEGRD